MRTIILSLLLLMGTVIGGTVASADAEVTITAPWIREAPPGTHALAGYMVLHNHGDADISLVGASGVDFKEVMLHETITRAKMATMVHLPQVAIPSKGQVTFKPGGMHLMLMQPKRALMVGDESTVTLIFADGAKAIATFKVKKPFSDDVNTNEKHH